MPPSSEHFPSFLNEHLVKTHSLTEGHSKYNIQMKAILNAATTVFVFCLLHWIKFAHASDKMRTVCFCASSPFSPSRQGAEAPRLVLVPASALHPSWQQEHYSQSQEKTSPESADRAAVAWQFIPKSVPRLRKLPILLQGCWISKAQCWIWLFQVSTTIMCNLTQNLAYQMSIAW